MQEDIKPNLAIDFSSFLFHFFTDYRIPKFDAETVEEKCRVLYCHIFGGLLIQINLTSMVFKPRQAGIARRQVLSLLVHAPPCRPSASPRRQAKNRLGGAAV